MLLAEYYASAIYFLLTPEAPARMSRLAHAVRELCLHLPEPWGGQAGPQAEQGEVRGIHQSVGSRSPAG
jgi:hypothetical protein